MTHSNVLDLHRSGLGRRGVLAGGAGAGLATTLDRAYALVPPRRDPLATAFSSNLQQLAPNVWAYIQVQGPGESNLLLSNCGVIAGPHTMMAIDTTAVPLQAKAFRAAAERATHKPFDRVVITHEHADHVLGLSFLPRVEVIAQDNTAIAMHKMIGSAKPPFWQREAGWADGDERYVYVQPTRTYRDHLRLQYGATQVDLIYPGPAHTLGDTLIHLPREKILFAGDIAFFGVTPLNGSGYVAGWIAACNRILQMDVHTIVPGHGRIGGKDELIAMRNYLELMYDAAKHGYAAGLAPGRAAAGIDLGAYRGWSDTPRVAGNIARIYTELAGTIRPEGDRAAADRARVEYMNLTK